MKKLMAILIGCALGAQMLTAAPEWLTSLPDAKTQAKKNDKLVLLDFTGSDWCPWCKQLDADVFSKPEFERYAAKNLVLVEVDFPNAKPQSKEVKEANAALQSQFKVEGFPTLVVMKPDGTVVWKQVGYLEGGPSAVIAKLNEAKAK
jgi:thioredoxin-related protein